MEKSLEAKPVVSDPADHGWIRGKNTEWQIDWMEGFPAPVAVLEFMSCKFCWMCDRHCIYKDNGLKCIEMCTLEVVTTRKQTLKKGNLRMLIQILNEIFVICTYIVIIYFVNSNLKS